MIPHISDLKRPNYNDRRQISGYQKVGGEAEYKGAEKEMLGLWTCSEWFCGGRYMTMQFSTQLYTKG